MPFYMKLQKSMNKLESVYDLAAFCYDYLIDKIDNQPVFFGRYIMTTPENDRVNPNLEDLGDFSRVIGQKLYDREKQGWDFQDCLKNVVSCSSEMQKKLKPFGDNNWNQATIPFFILLAIDRYVLEKDGKCTDPAPLNKYYCEKSHVYLNIGNNMLDKAVEKNKFSDCIEIKSIRNELRHLIILERQEIPRNVNVPKMVPLYVREEDKIRKRIRNGHKLRVAVIPFGEDCMLEFCRDEGVLFHVEYTQEYREKGKARALMLLDRALQEKANIIIFPEFVCSMEVQEAIRQRLVHWGKQDVRMTENLLLVIAGSGWIEDNNIASLYSYSGSLLGHNYKYSHYFGEKEGELWLENLKNPGKDVTIIDIDGVGKVMVGICRDVCDRTYIRTLAEIFAPQFLLVPAWSESVRKAFEQQFQEIVEKNHRTCSILCNCCQAIYNKAGFRVDNGLIVTPFKDGSLIIGKVDQIMREMDCQSCCSENGCIILVDLDFDPKIVKAGEIVEKITLEHA